MDIYEAEVPQIVKDAQALPEGVSEFREVSTDEANEIMMYALAQRYRNSIHVARRLAPFGLKYDKDKIFAWLKNPWACERKLRGVSNFMYNANGQYMRLCNYQPDMLKFSYIITPLSAYVDVNDKQFKDQYVSACVALDNMNIRTEFNKLMRTCMREGVAYGYARTSRDTFTLFILDSDYCRISSIDGTGCIRYEFDFTYFNRFPDKLREKMLDSYGAEMREKYEHYQTNVSDRWQEIGEDGICIKYQEDILDYSIPPYIAVLDNLFDLEDYRKLAKAREETGNYNLLNFTVPTTTDGKILMDLGLVKRFIDQTTSEIPSTIGVIYSPMKTEKISFAKDTTLADRNAVTEAVEQFWAASGVSELLFGSGKSSSNSLNKSIIADEINIYPVVRQIERWINRRMRLMRGKYKFKMKILDVTSFNESDVYDMYAKAGNSGVPVKNAMAAVLGYTPFDVLAMSTIENDVLRMRDEVFNEPLLSANQMSSEIAEGTTEEGGRPPVSDDDLSDAGEQTRVTEGNIRE